MLFDQWYAQLTIELRSLVKDRRYDQDAIHQFWSKSNVSWLWNTIQSRVWQQEQVHIPLQDSEVFARTLVNVAEETLYGGKYPTFSSVSDQVRQMNEMFIETALDTIFVSLSQNKQYILE
jgi:hypothetical protein